MGEVLDDVSGAFPVQARPVRDWRRGEPHCSLGEALDK